MATLVPYDRPAALDADWASILEGFLGYATGCVPEEETEVLKAQAEWLQEQLAAVNGRIEALKED